MVFLDICAAGKKLEGPALLEKVKGIKRICRVVMIPDTAIFETAVAEIKRGELRFHRKTVQSDRLILVATARLETSRMKREVEGAEAASAIASVLTGTVALDESVAPAVERGPRPKPYPDLGPRPVRGRNWRARDLHEASSRAARPFVVINEATIRRRVGSRTVRDRTANGEQARKDRRIGRGDGGTLFVDEKKICWRTCRAKPEQDLRVLVDQTFQR